MTSYIIFAFVSGFLLSAVIFWITTRQLQKDWHDEYRRLMVGISTARNGVVDLSVHRGTVANHLDKLYNNDPNWPRG